MVNAVSFRDAFFADISKNVCPDAEFVASGPNGSLLKSLPAPDASGGKTPDAGKRVVVIRSLHDQKLTLVIFDNYCHRDLVGLGHSRMLPPVNPAGLGDAWSSGFVGFLWPWGWHGYFFDPLKAHPN